MNKNIPAKRRKIIDLFRQQNWNNSNLTRQQIVTFCADFDVPFPQWIKDYQIQRGVYNISELIDGESTLKSVDSGPVIMQDAIPNVTSEHDHVSLVPPSSAGYVPFGNFNDLRTIINSRMFYPVYVTGLTGNGKTMMVEQVCASLGRELVRTNIIAETDEDDLLGGYRLIDGNTKWQDGPVVDAMKRGAILLLDEVDLGTPKMLCLQSVLEGKGIYIKKTKEIVYPERGFNVIATANTKGAGSTFGNYIGTNVLNEAFLERFAITMEQDYPSTAIEKKILKNHMSINGHSDEIFIGNLVKWANNNRKLYKDGSFSDIITTRRLVHILNAYMIFGSRQKALDYGLARFELPIKKSLIEFYSLIDADYVREQESVNETNLTPEQETE